MARYAVKSVQLISVVVMGLLLSACVTLMAPFDETTNELATGLQRKVSTHFEAIDGARAPECLHANHQAFYDEARVDVSALEVRARAFDMNRQTIQSTVDLRQSVNDLEQLHQSASRSGRCMSASEISPLRRAFDSHIGAIIRLEIAKKRGA